MAARTTKSSLPPGYVLVAGGLVPATPRTAAAASHPLPLALEPEDEASEAAVVGSALPENLTIVQPGGDLVGVESWRSYTDGFGRVEVKRPRVLHTGATQLTSMSQSMSKETKVVFGASYQLSSGATGVTNALVSNDMLSALGEFKTMGTLYREFFIEKFEVSYMPFNRYDDSRAVANVNAPLVVVPLMHSAPPFGTHTDACSSGRLLICDSCDPWKCTWTNNEKKSQGVLTSASSTAAFNTQAWCLTDATSSALYQGALQIIQPAALALAASRYLGVTVVRWSVRFRSRA